MHASVQSLQGASFRYGSKRGRLQPRWRSRGTARVLVLSFLLLLTEARAGNLPVAHFLQDDQRWGNVEILNAPLYQGKVQRLSNCGCLLSVTAMVLNYMMSTTRGTPFIGAEFSPLYMYRYLSIPRPLLLEQGEQLLKNDHEYTGPVTNWGFRAKENCGVDINPGALSVVGNPGVLVGSGEIRTLRTGVEFGVIKGKENIRREARNVVLNSQFPVALITRHKTGNHSRVVIGFDDSDPEKYIVLDPGVPLPRGMAYKDTESEKTIALVVYGPIDRQLPIVVLADDPGDFEFLAISRHGKKTGYDPALGKFVYEDPGAGLTESYNEGATGGSLLGKSLWVDARTASKVELVGTGYGTYSFDAYRANGEDRLGITPLSGSIAPGERIKYLIEEGAGGPILTQTSNFAPDVRLPEIVFGKPGQPIEITGRASFDADGDILDFAWDFGDGSSGTGAQVTHAYASPGKYIVTLTVTDDHGAAGVGAVAAYVEAPGDSAVEMVNLSQSGTPTNINAASDLELSVSHTGRFVAFRSSTPLVSDATTWPQVYVRDTTADITEIVSIMPEGTPPHLGAGVPSISGDGRWIAFQAFVEDPTGATGPWIYLRDRAKGTTVALDATDIEAAVGIHSHCERPILSADGRYLVALCGGDALPGVLVLQDTATGTIDFVDRPPDGSMSEGDVTAYYAYALSGNGRFVAFLSGVSNLVPGDTNAQADVFVWDRQQRVMERVSVSSTGQQANTESREPAISADGRYVAFSSAASNLVPGTTSGLVRIYLHDRSTKTTQLVSGSPFAAQPNGNSFRAQFGIDGQQVFFFSHASNLVPGDLNNAIDLFVRDMSVGSVQKIEIPGHPTLPGPTIFPFAVVAQSGRSIALPELNGLPPGGSVYLFDRQFGSPPGHPIAVPSGPYLGWATSAEVPTAVAFDASGSFEPDGVVTGVRWNFGDGTPALTGLAHMPVTHSYTKPGRYTATLTVTNGQYDSDFAAVAVDIRPALSKPSSLLSPTCGDAGTTVTVSGYTEDTTLTTNGWNLSKGPFSLRPARVTLFDEEREIPVSPQRLDFSTETVFRGPAGTYTIGLTNGEGATFVSPCPPPDNELPEARAGGPYLGTTTTPLILDGTQSFDPEGNALTFLWSFGDGTPLTPGAQPSHQYTNPGTYRIVLWVHDGVDSSRPYLQPLSITSVIITDGSTTDSAAPSTLLDLSAPVPSNGWHTSDVTLLLTASDNVGGSGVKHLVYRTEGAQSSSDVLISGDAVSIIISNEGITTVHYYAVDLAGNAEVSHSFVVRLDKSAPMVTCSGSDGQWHPSDIAIGCTARDEASGLSGESLQACGGEPICTSPVTTVDVQLFTQVPLGTETDTATTNSLLICDVAGHCATAGPVGGHKVDKKAPQIAIIAPASASYLLGQPASAVYLCQDAGSGVSSCIGTVPSGSLFDTSTVGDGSFVVEALDAVGNRALRESRYSVDYNVCLLYDPYKPQKSGSAIPLRLQLCDAAGNNRSASAIVVKAGQVIKISSEVSSEPADEGNANPDQNFRYDQSLAGGAGGYIYNFNTIGLTSGSYRMHFFAGTSGTGQAPFQVK